MRIKLNVGTIASAAPSSTLIMGFYNITNAENVNSVWEGITQITITRNVSNLSAGVIQNDTTFTLTALTLPYLSATQDYIIFDCTLDIYATNNLQTLIDLGYIETDVEDYVTMILYRLNSENNVLDKTLINVGVAQGIFKAPIGIKNIVIDYEAYPLETTFNYVYIPKLKRYYYVNNIELMSASFTRLSLSEDVLMSWQDLIKQQDAFISRYGLSIDRDLVDTRYPIEDNFTVEYLKPSNISGGYVNATLDYDQAGEYNILFYSIVALDLITAKMPISAPSNIGLPDISNLISTTENVTFITKEQFDLINIGTKADDVVATFINSIIWLPFNPATVFNLASSPDTPIFAGDKMIFNTDPVATRWVEASSHTPDIYGYSSNVGASPYIIIADFYFNTSLNIRNDFLDFEPFTYWEIYIPFVSWIPLNIKDLRGKRLMIYYSLDIDSGTATAFLHNVTDKKTIWSGACQLGIKLSTITTNALENAKQQQAIQLNMLMSMISSAVATGVGVASKNPVAVAGGALSFGKAISSAVNQNNTIFERANASLGSSNNALHSPLEVYIRRTYHAPIITSSDDYNRYVDINGKPYNKYVNISNLLATYYIEVGEIHFDPKGNDIYNVEVDDIVALLRNGVIL